MREHKHSCPGCNILYDCDEIRCDHTQRVKFCSLCRERIERQQLDQLRLHVEGVDPDVLQFQDYAAGVAELSEGFSRPVGTEKTKSLQVIEEAAKVLAEEYGQTQVMIVTWSEQEKLTYTVSYGVSHRDSEEAAIGMEFIRRALGYSPEERNLLPPRVEVDYDRAEACLGIREGQQPDPSLHHLIVNHRLAGIVAWALQKLYQLVP
jgi:hypothetical protein